MENIRNKIITISGEPASGKSTVVKEIKSKYEKQGFNVYIISVGDVFRETVKKEYLKRYPDRINVSLADIQNDKEFMAKLQSIDVQFLQNRVQFDLQIDLQSELLLLYQLINLLRWHL